MLLETSYPAVFAESATTLAVLLYGDLDGYSTAQLIVERWRQHLPRTAFALRLIGHGAPRLEDRFKELEDEFGLSRSHITLIGLGTAADATLRGGLKSEEGFAAILGFNIQGDSLETVADECRNRSPVFLVHGALNPNTPPPAFLAAFQRLTDAGIPVSICFRPEVGLEITSHGLDAAMYFLQGAFAALLSAKVAKLPKPAESLLDRAKTIKAIIWDLDDTLWDGTLDDVGTIALKTFRVETIRRLNGCGLVSAICSKNDFATAKAKLEELGLWDEFVFPRIAFVPKGEALKAMISDMQLRPKNCLFIDDNAVNLAEAQSVLPDLHILDATKDACDAFLQALLDAHGHIQKSRVEDYRALQNRVSESRSHTGSREDFLKSCDIHVAVVHASDLIDFAPRIEELINRTNQLNFLKTRVEPGSMAAFLSEPSLRAGFALFAWDKFGYHGLVGFIGVDVREKSLLHMAFSCRVMHMGMENMLLGATVLEYPNLVIPDTLRIRPGIPLWIQAEDYNAPEIRAFILDKEKNLEVDPSRVKIRFMAHCHSGTFAHFSGLRDIAEIDNFPRVFALPLTINRNPADQNFPEFLVYYTGLDYIDKPWPEAERPELETKLYPACAENFARFLQDSGRKMLVIPSAAPIREELYWEAEGLTPKRLRGINAVWDNLATRYDCIDVMDVEGMFGADGMVDSIHFKVEASQKIATEIASWYARRSTQSPLEQAMAS